VKTSSRIHRGLVGARELVGRSYLADGELRHEYETEIAPRTEAALAWILNTAALPEPRRVLDLGAGTGAVGRAVRARFANVEVIAVDKVAGPGLVQADVTRALRPTGVEGRFDWIVAAHLLNELSLDVERRVRLVLGWMRELMAPDGQCILVEPALRETSRALLTLRDRLRGDGCFIAAPCLWQGDCPALARERDFCHASAGSVAEGRSRVDFSYLVVRRQGQPRPDKDLFRIVSDPMKDKGRLRMFGCGPAGRMLVMRLDREHSERNQAFGTASRGDLLRIQGAEIRPDGLRCTPECDITIESGGA